MKTKIEIYYLSVFALLFPGLAPNLGAQQQTLSVQQQFFLDPPLDNPTVKGTYGDSRGFRFHGGIDIHEPPANGVAAPVKPVKNYMFLHLANLKMLLSVK